ncbi:unnamed protein product [Rotaria sp. Silwood2]|nr:unnamed protein product [Rotaria sp. Silwood2]
MKENFIDAYTSFNSTFLFSTIAESRFSVDTKVKLSLNSFLDSAVSYNNRILFIARQTTVTNGLISSLGTNYYLVSADDETQLITGRLYVVANTFKDGCSCSDDRQCPQSVVLFGNNGTSIQTIIPGMIFDCLLLDGVLVSSLECFYDSQCISLLQDTFMMDTKVKPLSALSRFLPNVTIGKLLNELMIEELTTKIDFSSYYKKCNPAFCTYSYTHRFDILFIITTFISVLSGASTILKFISPILIKMILKIVKWKRQGESIGINQNQISSNDKRSFSFSRKF